MDGYKFLKPAKGLIIRDPITKQQLNEEGELKPFIGNEGSYWRRRVNEGSCIIIENDNTKKKDEIIFDEKNNIVKKGGK